MAGRCRQGRMTYEEMLNAGSSPAKSTRGDGRRDAAISVA